jgi:uncharacterized membrane protein YphA (DoxX/SURF4 family)
MDTVPIVLSILLGLAFLAAGLPKLAGAAQSRDRMAHLRLPLHLTPAIGLVEVAAAGVLAGGVASSDPALTRLGAALVVVTMLGAVAAHVRVGEWAQAAPAAVLGLIAIVTAIVAE